MDAATISILVVIVGCVVGLAEWIRLMKNDAGLMASQIRTLETKMQVFEEHLKELEEDEELIENIVQKALEERIVNEKNLALLQEKFDLQKK